MRVVAEQRDGVAALVEGLAPGSSLTEKGGNHVSFSLPPAGLDLPALFEQVRNRHMPTLFSAVLTFCLIQNLSSSRCASGTL